MLLELTCGSFRSPSYTGSAAIGTVERDQSVLDVDSAASASLAEDRVVGDGR